MRSPAETEGESAGLRMVTSAQRTVMTEGGVVGLPSLVVVTEAVLVTVPLWQGPVAPVVGLAMWTCTKAAGARSVVGPPKCRTPPEIVQAGSMGSTVQLSPGLAGSRSETVTPWAVPVPLFLTVIV